METSKNHDFPFCLHTSYCIGMADSDVKDMLLIMIERKQMKKRELSDEPSERQSNTIIPDDVSWAFGNFI